MTDRELLELAAKAAGVRVDRWHGDGAGIWRGEPMQVGKEAIGHWVRWDPLADHGDELRLAEALGISIDFADCCAWKRLRDGRLIQEFWGGDFDPRHSHAVLRAAAALVEGGFPGGDSAPYPLQANTEGGGQ